MGRGTRWWWGLGLLLTACATTGARLEPGQRRAVAERRLESCLGWTVGRPVPALQRQACIEESKAFCVQGGLEATCGMAGLWARAGSSWSH